VSSAAVPLSDHHGRDLQAPYGQELRVFLGDENENNLLHSELARFDFTPLEEKATQVVCIVLPTTYQRGERLPRRQTASRYRNRAGRYQSPHNARAAWLTFNTMVPCEMRREPVDAERLLKGMAHPGNKITTAAKSATPRAVSARCLLSW